ncbi:zinc finger protein 879 [Drosophila eugracilis]|uniref:zinc finger protein 879 n=1 Tax=Drosophila eugracilis TaxID=29029 RepID=UPI0007E63D43|nr:zinc finger protein 879 [Drosophila eugracilis]
MSLVHSLKLPAEPLPQSAIDALCRVCHISSPRCLPLFKPLNNLISGKLTTLANILSYCSGLEILETEFFLPHHICPECTTKLRLSLEFKRSVHRMDRILRQSHADFCRTKRRNELNITSRISPEIPDDIVIVLDDQEVAEDPVESFTLAEEHLNIKESRKIVTESPLDEGLDLELEIDEDIVENEMQNNHTIELHLMAKATDDLYEIIDESKEPPVKAQEIQERLSCKSGTGKTSNPLHECPVCFKHLSSDRTFQYHMRLHGAQNAREEIQPHKVDSTVKESLQNKTHIQDKGAENLYDIVDETRQPLVASKSVVSRSRQWKLHNPSLQCQICGKQLSTNNSFKYHMQLHGTATPYVCKICGESFKTRNAYDGHVTLHDVNNPNRCPICFKVYRQASSLRTHLLIHSGIKPFECNICGKRLTQKSGYKKHMLTHTGEKPHSCDICERRFRYSSNLIAHKRCHSQEKPHHCQVCQKRSFGSRSELNRHMLVHSSKRPFGCEECGKSFKRQVSLSIHQQSHKEGKKKKNVARKMDEQDNHEET